jgi:hypothetical protein
MPETKSPDLSKPYQDVSTYRSTFSLTPGKV